MRTVRFLDLRVGDFIQYRGSIYQVISIIKELKEFPGLSRNSYIIQFDRCDSGGMNWISGDRYNTVDVLTEEEQSELYKRLCAYLAHDPANA